MKRLFQSLILAVLTPCLAAGACMAADATPAALQSASSADCPAAAPFPNGAQVIRGVRVYTAANGESDFETLTYTGEGKAYFKPGEIFTHNDLGPAAKVQVISGPANVQFKPHTGPRELFLIVQGSSTIVLPNGKAYALTPGTVAFFDDATSKTGHGGRSGPCGYVAINIVPPEAGAKP